MSNIFGTIVNTAKAAAGAVGDQVYDDFQTGMDNFGHGLEQLWYNLTGQKHLTDTYKHEEQLELNKNQLTAQDMEKAGLSKYLMSGSSVGSLGASSGNNGIDLLNGIMAYQQIKRNALELKEGKYNLELSRRLGIRTGDTNELSKISAYVKALTGYGVEDIPNGGILGALLDKLGFKHNTVDNVNDGSVSPVAGGAVATLDVPPLHPADEDRDFAVFRNNLAKATKNFTADIDSGYLRHFMKSSVADLVKLRGMSEVSAMNLVNSWLDSLLSNYENVEWNKFITNYKIDRKSDMPVGYDTEDGYLSYKDGGYAW